MPILNDTDLFRQIKQGDIKSVYLLYGEEKHFISACVQKVVAKIVPKGFESFNVIKFNDEKISLNELEDAVLTLPMMTEKKCVLVKDLDIDKLNKNEFDYLLQIVLNSNESTILLIYATELDYQVKKSSKLKKLADSIQKNGVVCDFSLKDKPTLKRALCERAKKAGVEMEMMVAEALIDRCSQSYAVLINEVDKLIFYVLSRDEGNREIKIQDIDDCCIASVDSTSFDLAKAILNRKYEKAFFLLDELFYQRIEPLSILGALNMCFIDLYRAKCAMMLSQSVDKVIVDFNYPKNRSFAVKNSFRDVQNYSIESIRNCLDALIEADYQIKSSKLSQRVILENMIARMI